MQLQHMQAFLALARELNFRRAAARLYLSQPALSAQIAELERHLGVRLFARNRSGTRLTADGTELLPLVESAVEAVLDVELAARSSPRHRRRFAVGILGGVGVGDLTWPLLRTFSEARPDLRLEIIQMLAFGDVLPSLRSGKVDVLLAIGPFGEEDGVTTTVGSIPIGAILPSTHPRAQDACVDVSWLAEHLTFRTATGAGRTFAEFWTLKDVADRKPDGLPALAGAIGVQEFMDTIGSGAIAAWPAVVPALPPAVVRPVTGGPAAPLQVLTPHRRNRDVDQFCGIALRLAGGDSGVVSIPHPS